MSEYREISDDELDLAMEKAYRRGFQQALALLATCYPRGVRGPELIRLANEHLQWRRELPQSGISDNAAPRFANAISPLERRCMRR